MASNQFLDIAAEFQQKMTEAGLTAEAVMAGQVETRQALYERLYGDDAGQP